jgi:YYY domain-containing protein
VAALSLWVLRRIPRQELRDWWRAHRKQVVGVEALFLVAFAGWAFVRAANPDIAGTEKPMELAFINAILRSPDFPPHDPWLSGYAISYYYFGYVLVAMLARVTGVSGSVAFNLAVALVFALSAIGVYGVVFNLLSLWNKDRDRPAGDRSLPPAGGRGWPVASALLGPFFVLVVSNLAGFLEVLHSRGIFWSRAAAGQLASPFWKWLDMRELSQPPDQPFSWVPDRFLWWWRASRVLQDYDLAGNWKEIIDEFPFFSYLLADLHPHVLAMPFAFLAMGICLNLFLGGMRGHFRWLGLPLRIHPPGFWLIAVVLGGLAFLNTWDFPIYLALFCGAYVLSAFQVESSRAGPEPGAGPQFKTGSARAYTRSVSQMVKDFLSLGLALGVTGILLYLPFYLGFSSQAGGILPNLIYATRGAHLWVMFGSFLLPMSAFLIYLWRQAGRPGLLRKGLPLVFGVLLLLWLAALLLGLAIVNLPVLGDYFLDTLGARDLPDILFQQSIVRRVINLGSLATLAAILVVTVGLLLRAGDKGRREKGKVMLDQEPLTTSTPFPLTPPDVFALLLILLGALLVLGPEFFYLRDQFGWRMNTIFKFYYQAWLLWGTATAYGTAVLLRQLNGKWGALFSFGLVLVLAMALVYPLFGLWGKTGGFSPPQGFSLDGGAFLKQNAPDEMAAIEWLRSAPAGVVVEAVGGSYSEYARVATFSGQPGLLGWPGHESQWRGGAEEMGTRQSDIERIYRSNNWTEVQDLLQQYGVRYVFVGSLEHTTYRVNETKFKRFLTPAFQQGQVTVYEVP